MTGAFPAVILAGGRSTRLGGGDKPLRPLAGKPLLAHIVGRLARQAGPLALNANGDPARFETFGLPVVADTVSGFAGPLAGILAGLEWAFRTGGHGHVATVAGDTPFFPENLVDGLGKAADGEKIVLAASGGRVHPVFGLWPLGVRAELVRFLAANQTRRVMTFAETVGYVVADFGMIAVGGREVDPFFNVNTAEDLAEAEAICRELHA